MVSASFPRTGVILVAGGSGVRLGYGMPKAQVPVAGVTMLGRALAGIAESGVAAAVAVAVPAGDTVLRAVCAAFDTRLSLAVVEGGATRAESVHAALAALPEDLSAILVHDAARALTPPAVFHRVVTALAEGAEAVIPAVPVVDTIKEAAGGSTADGLEHVAATVDRSRLRAVQTPQGFDAALLRRAHRSARTAAGAALADAVTDDAMLVEALGATVRLVEGSEESLKITTPLDLLIAEALVARREAGRNRPGADNAQAADAQPGNPNTPDPEDR